MEKSNNNVFFSFLFAEPGKRVRYVFVVLRIIIGYTWLVRDIPRWTALAAGHPVDITPFLKNLPQAAVFGSGNANAVFYFATTLETAAGILLILGLGTRLAALWGVVEFFINGTTGLVIGSLGLQEDYSLFGGNLALLLFGSQLLSFDGLITRRRTKPPR